MQADIKFIIHLIFVVIGTAWFLYSYIKERKVYQILFVVWIPITLLTYLSSNKVYLWTLGIVQLLLFLLVIYFLFRNPNRKKGGYQQMLKELDSYGGEEAAASEEGGAPDTEQAADLMETTQDTGADQSPEESQPL